jgi:hypothetical protein
MSAAAPTNLVRLVFGVLQQRRESLFHRGVRLGGALPRGALKSACEIRPGALPAHILISGTTELHRAGPAGVDQRVT